MIIIKYEHESERQSIIDEQISRGLKLIAISNITEGNFLGFDDRDIIPTLPKVSVIEEQLNNINNTVDILLLKQEGIL